MVGDWRTKTVAEILGLLAQGEPVKEQLRGLEPDGEPLRDLFFLRALVRRYLAVAGDQGGAAAHPNGAAAALLGEGAFISSAAGPVALIERAQGGFGGCQRVEVKQL